MTDRNAYAPPKASISPVRPMQCSRDGKWAVVATGSDLPPRCIICNAPAQLPIKPLKIYWHTPWIYLLILVQILIYVVVGLIVRRKAVVSPGLCAEHAKRRSRRLWAGVGIGLLLLGVGFVLVATDEAAVGALTVTTSMVVLVTTRILTRKVYARKITKEYASLGGCKEPFLAGLE